MSYWHIVDALYVLWSVLNIGRLGCARIDDLTGNENAWTLFVGLPFTAYLIHNIWPDVAGMVHSVSMCHG